MYNCHYAKAFIAVIPPGISETIRWVHQKSEPSLILIGPTTKTVGCGMIRAPTTEAVGSNFVTLNEEVVTKVTVFLFLADFR